MKTETPKIEDAYKAYAKSLMSILHRYLKDQQDIEDILHETFIRVLKYDTTFRGESDYKTWITRIAINTALNHLKANKKMSCTRFEQQEYWDAVAVNISSAELCAIADEELSMFDENVKSISEELWNVFVMFQLEGDALEEIASKLKIPEGTVKSRLSRARKAILGLE